MEMTETKTKSGRLKKIFKNPAKLAFWSWVGYQAVKGTMTTTFIWIPLLYLWFQHH